MLSAVKHFCIDYHNWANHVLNCLFYFNFFPFQNHNFLILQEENE